MPENATLVIRHFPHSYSKEERTEFMRTFNAIEVKCLISKFKKQSIVFAKFNTRIEAETVLRHLHQAELEEGHRLSVEFARGSENAHVDKDSNDDFERCQESKENVTSQRRIYEDFLNKLNSWSRHLDFRHPPPHHLSYQYPPPSLVVLTNIAKALAAVPKFYTQVLHLMNKMCLPCPFTENYKINSDIVPALLNNLFSGEDIKNAAAISKFESKTSEESEIESDPDTSVLHISTVGLKRTLNTKSKSRAKRLRLVKPPPPTTKNDKPGQGVKPEEVFELPHQTKTEAKKIEVKVIRDLNTIAPSSSEADIIVEGFEKMEPVQKINSNSDKDKSDEDILDENQEFITKEELERNRISYRDQKMLPVFKNYQPGLPSCRLYLKNLAKNVEISDLKYIYNRFFIKQEEEQGTMFDIRLMQEGRMKGQAFITLQNEIQAEIALKETNGYILKGKPIVVQFARAKPK